MTEFLVKHFVPNYEQTEDARVRTSYGIMASVVGVVCNLILFVVKLVIGTLLGSIAVMADAFNNLSDGASSIISFVGVKLASRPADREHPFGHGRYEYIAAFVVAFMILEVGLTFVKSAWDKIWHPTDISFSLISVVILTLSILVKVWLSLFNRKLGRRIHSQVMKATAADAMGDVLTTAATIVSILIYKIFDLNVDGYVGMLVAFMVLWAGFNIAKETLEPLIGEAVDPELAKEIKHLVESYEGIIGSHDLIVHNYGPTRRMATIHAEVPNDVDIEASHELIDRIEYEVTKKTGVYLVIHMDPIETKDEKVLTYRDKVYEILKDLDPEISAHDFRMVDGRNQINLIFDVVIPYSYNDEKQNQLMLQIIDKVSAYDSRCKCVITMENSYVATESES